MTQRIFDIENKKDMADLWDILSEEVIKIVKQDYGPSLKYYGDNDNVVSITSILKIDFHDKTEITRPIQEATEADIGKLCYFWDDKVYDDEEEYKGYAILTLKDVAGGKPYYIADGNTTYEHCRRLTKQEIEEIC